MRGENPERARPRALVTGASSGIGLAFAERLAQDGYDLTVVARRKERLEALARGLEAHGSRVEVVVCDLAAPEDLRALEARVVQQPPDLLVNNAGLGQRTVFRKMDPGDIDTMLAVHVTALVRLTRAALPGMTARGSGTVINLSSITAFMPVPSAFSALYAATKAFVNAFSRGVQAEVGDRGVTVQALCPGWTRTEIIEAAGGSWDIPESATMSPEKLVAASLAGLARGEVVCVPSLEDDGLLSEDDARRGAIFGQAVTSGTPARRYGLEET